MLLECKNVYFYKKPNQAILEDINFSLDYKDTIIIYSGVNSGSTLLLKIIDNVVENVKGEILFEGKNILKFDRDEKLDYTYKVSFVFEREGLFYNMNIIENILFPLKKYTTYDKSLLNELIRDFKIENILYKEPSEIDDIETMLVNIVRAIIVKPKLILYDEMDGGMDKEMVQNIVNLLEKYQQKIGFSQIITTVKNYPYEPYKKYRSFLLLNKKLKELNANI